MSAHNDRVPKVWEGSGEGAASEIWNSDPANARIRLVEAIGTICSEETQRQRVRNAQHALRYRAELLALVAARDTREEPDASA